jgi:hypothetical protein
VAALSGSLAACGDYLTGPGISDNPNAPLAVETAQLFQGIQLTQFVQHTGDLSRHTAMWTQQMAGIGNQYSGRDQYVTTEQDLAAWYNAIYTGGGLVDIRRARAISDSVSCPQCSALFAIHEAYLVGMGASIFGDLPYRGALVEGTPAPLDPQAQVYADVQALLDGAIAGLSTAPTGGAAAFYSQLSAVDLIYGGTRSRWIAAAQTLKARYYLHWVEGQVAGGAAAAQSAIACGGNCLTKARTAALAGIQSAAGDWRAFHTNVGSEANFFYQFFDERAGYLVAGNHLVELLKARNDARLKVYFEPVSGNTFVGSRAGEANQAASVLADDGAGAANFRQPMVTCAENQFILAEVEFRLGNTAPARAALLAGMRCAEETLGVQITNPTTAQVNALSGNALLEEIITQKYIALFLNMEVYNDYKRTCLPRLTTFNNRPIPGRLFYGQQERQTNPNIPQPDQQPRLNANDPVDCSGR